MMVSQDSAKLFYPREKLLAVDENHSQIAKVKFGESGIYPDICSAISRALSDTPAITQVSAHQEPPTSPGTMQDVNARSKIDKVSYSRDDRVEKVSKPT